MASVPCMFTGCGYNPTSAPAEKKMKMLADEMEQLHVHVREIHRPVLKVRVVPEEYLSFVSLWEEYKQLCSLTDSADIRDQLMACCDVVLHQSMGTKSEAEILAEMERLTVKVKCKCSLDLGLHPFPSSSDQEVDMLEDRFPSDTAELNSKAEEFYLHEGSPSFKLFPPMVRPDTKLGPFPPDSMADQTENNDEWFKRCAALSSEQEVAKAFISYFSKHQELEGFMIRSFHTDTNLGNLKERAKRKRKESAKKKQCLPLSSIERDICDCLGVDIGEKIKQETLNNENSDPSKKIMPEEIPFHCYQEVITASNFELDVLLLLPQYIVELEVKSATGAGYNSVKNVLTKAAKQLKNVNRTFIGSHKDILGKEWNFVRAISTPNINKTMLSEDICCPHCASFILDSDDIKKSSIWIQNLLTFLPSTSCSSDAYKKIFARIVGFYSCSENHSVSVTMSQKEARVENEKAITGQESGISSEKSGAVPGQSELKGKKKKAKKPLGQSTIYLTPAQLGILKNAKNFRRLLLDSDFGTGKSLILKQFASDLAKLEAEKIGTNQTPKAVYFVSLASTRHQRHIKIPELAAVFDVATEIDFENSDVKVIGAKHLLEHYKYNNKQDAKCVNDLLVQFMKDNEGDHYFIDEVPTTIRSSFSGPDLCHLTGPGSSDSYVWIALRPGSVPSMYLSKYNTDYNEYKQKMIREQFDTPELSYNMRNSGGVVETCQHIMSDKLAVDKSTVKPATLPPNPVTGNPPVVVTRPLDENHCDKHLPHNLLISVIEKYFSDPSEPIVVIADQNIIAIVEQCRKLLASRGVIAYCSGGDEVAKIKKFLRKPEGILITNEVAFGGMQARNIIIVSDKFFYNVRNNLLRAISQIVYIDTDKQSPQNIHKVTVENSSIIVDRIATCCFETTGRLLT